MHSGIKSIFMTSWSSINCGGEGISVEVANSDGSKCLTTSKDISRGETLHWSFGRGLDGDCSSMVVDEDSTLYIQTSSTDDFCPKRVWLRTEKGDIYTSSNISAWYDKDKTNSKKHALEKSSSQPGL